jgi:uncharacterized DUF497 family protein
MKISFDPAKRAETLRKRRLDFLDAEEVFAGLTYTIPDQRFAYPEERLSQSDCCRAAWRSWCGRPRMTVVA